MSDPKEKPPDDETPTVVSASATIVSTNNTNNNTTSICRRQRSKVRPLQLATGIGPQPPATWKLPQAPWARELDCVDFQLESRTDKSIWERIALINRQAKLSCRLFSQDFAEICFVGGYITALIGSLVAISGIFTRNQARTRLYMEGFGCAMVILGVLVVFFSLRMRANKDMELTQLRHLFQQSRDVNQQRNHHNNNHHNQNQQQQQQQLQQHPPPPPPTPIRDTSLAVVANSGLVPTGATPNDLPPSPAPSIRITPTQTPDCETPSIGGGSSCGQHRMSPAETSETMAANGCRLISPQVAPIATTGFVLAPSVLQRELTTTIDSDPSKVSESSLVGFQLADEDELSLASNRPSQWTPCANEPDWSYPNDLHESATIEAALSIVLTVATLAGFRPDGAEMRLQPGADKHEHFCCLHHTVQHKLQARKWINCLKAHNQPQAITKT